MQPQSETIIKPYFLNKLKQDLSKLLTNDENNTSVFRLHTKQLTSLGELSFQTNLDFAAWKHLNLNNDAKDTIKNIFDYASTLHNNTINEATLKDITQEMDSFLKIAKSKIIKTNCHIFLDRKFVTKMIITDIMTNNNYGSYKLDYDVKLDANYTNVDDLDVSELRIEILQQIIQNFVKESDFQANSNKVEVLLTCKSSDTHPNKILCGCVLDESEQKKSTMTASELYDDYASNMRMMFEHKYGVRNITAQANWKTKIDKLGHAAVTFQMIQNTPQKTIALSCKHHVIKNAAFVIYNGARIASILRRFSTEFPNLLELADVDFSHLKLDEEWELIYAYLAQYPIVVKHCVHDLKEGKVSFHHLSEFLVHFSTAFSVYYSRFKILTEAKDHLLPMLYARIYLLRSVEHVLHHALKLLNVELVNQM